MKGNKSDFEGCPPDLDPKLHCIVCEDKCFSTIEDTIRHMQQEHPDLFVWWCEIIDAWRNECE